METYTQINKQKKYPHYTQPTEVEAKYFNKSIKEYSGNKKYLLQERIFSGGMGSIFKVIDQNLNRTSAMKVILPYLRNDEANLNSFVAEAKITGLLEHPNIIPVHDLGLGPETGIFFTMKLAKGEALIDILKKIKSGNQQYLEKYNLFHLLEIFKMICNAVAFAHSKDIIHQDIKPHNIMIGAYGEVLLMDWGIAKFIGNIDNEHNPAKKEILKDILRLSKNTKGKILGTPSYMSPEQIKGKPELLDKQTDIFQLGATLYHIATLYSPYCSKDVYATLRRAGRGEFIEPQLKNPERQIPDALCKIILKAMSFDKEKRYKSVEKFSQDIQAIISGKWLGYIRKKFTQGEYLMTENEPGNEAYLILKGRVEVFKKINNRKIVLGINTTGDIIGEMALINKENRSASVKALKNTETAVLTKEIISQNVKNLPPYMEKILSSISSRLRESNKRIHPYADSDCTYIVLKQFRFLYLDSVMQKRRFLLKDIIPEIGQDLGIPKSKVIKALSTAAKAKLIICKNNKIIVPDMDNLIDFTELSRLWM